MSLNCLTCQVLIRTDSNNDKDSHVKEKDSMKFCCTSIGRSWSGNISPAAYEQIRIEPISVVPPKKIKKLGHRRLKTIGAETFETDGAGPRLVRSSGMRRDWSFEDLRGQRDDKMRIR
ncbi:hypothetical protein REPUB_Repub08aG0223600 [Reevesia pubescens]